MATTGETIPYWRWSRAADPVPVSVWRYPNCGQWLNGPAMREDATRDTRHTNFTEEYHALPVADFAAILAAAYARGMAEAARLCDVEAGEWANAGGNDEAWGARRAGDAVRRAIRAGGA